MVKKLSAAGELAKLAASREAQIERQRQESERQTQKEFEQGTLDPRYIARQAKFDAAQGKETQYTLAEKIRTGSPDAFDALAAALDRGEQSAELVLQRLGIIREPTAHTINLSESLNIGAGKEAGGPKTQPPEIQTTTNKYWQSSALTRSPKTQPPETQTTTYEKVLPQTYGEDYASFSGEKGLAKATSRPDLKDKRNKLRLTALYERNKNKTASALADLLAQEAPDQQYLNYDYGDNLGIGEFVSKAKNWREAWALEGKPIPDMAAKQAPQRSKTQVEKYYAGIYANPNFDVDAKTPGIQPYNGIDDYEPIYKYSRNPVTGIEELTEFSDKTAHLSKEDFEKAGGILRPPLTPEQKAYYKLSPENRDRSKKPKYFRVEGFNLVPIAQEQKGTITSEEQRPNIEPETNTSMILGSEFRTSPVPDKVAEKLAKPRRTQNQYAYPIGPITKAESERTVGSLLGYEPPKTQEKTKEPFTILPYLEYPKGKTIGDELGKIGVGLYRGALYSPVQSITNLIAGEEIYKPVTTVTSALLYPVSLDKTPEQIQNEIAENFKKGYEEGGIGFYATGIGEWGDVAGAGVGATKTAIRYGDDLVLALAKTNLKTKNIFTDIKNMLNKKEYSSLREKAIKLAEKTRGMKRPKNLQEQNLYFQTSDFPDEAQKAYDAARKRVDVPGMINALKEGAKRPEMKTSGRKLPMYEDEVARFERAKAAADEFYKKNPEYKEKKAFERQIQKSQAEIVSDDIMRFFEGSESGGVGSGKSILKGGAKPSSEAKILRMSEAGENLPETKVSKSGGGFFAKRKDLLIPLGVAGAATSTAFLLDEDLNEKPDKKQKPIQYFGQIPAIDEAEKDAQRLFQPTGEKQKSKDKTASVPWLAVLEEYGLGQEGKQKQRQSQRYRIPVPEVPDLGPFEDQPTKQKNPTPFPEDYLRIPEGAGRFGLPFSFGGFGFDGDSGDADINKFFRVYDVGKTPFGKVGQYLGYYEDSVVPNYEIERKAKVPLAMARPRAIQDEYQFIKEFLSEPERGSSSKKRKRK